MSAALSVQDVFLAARDGKLESGTVRVRLDNVTNTGETGILTGDYRQLRSGHIRLGFIGDESGAFKWVSYFSVI